MRRTHYLVLIALLVGFGLVATSAFAQAASSGNTMRFGVGTSITRLNDGILGKTSMMPLAILDFDKAAVEFGFNLRSGESQTQFMLQLGGAYYPFSMKAGELGFGVQFNLETDAVVINNEGQSSIMFGLYTEYKAHATDSLDFGLRVFPFQLFHTENYSRIGLFSPGFSAGFFF